MGLEQHLGPKNNLGPEKTWVLKLRFIYFKHLRWLGTVAVAILHVAVAILHNQVDNNATPSA